MTVSATHNHHITANARSLAGLLNLDCRYVSINSAGNNHISKEIAPSFTVPATLTERPTPYAMLSLTPSTT